MSREAGVFLLWLEWPEACFRATESDEEYLRELVDGKLRVIRVTTRREFIALLPAATHILTWHFDHDWFGVATQLRLLATPAAGRELIAWQNPPINVRVHFGGFHGPIMAESVAAFCLAWARGFLRRRPSTGLWPRSWLGDKCFTLAGTRAAIVGYGRIGRAIGAKLASLGVIVNGFSRANIADLPQYAESADWLILALPSDTGTDNILNAELIEHLPKRAAVINVGRGNAVDEDALASALASGRIAAAYLDVFKSEPTQLNTAQAAGSVKHIYELDLPTLFAMPHSSAFSPDYVKACIKELKDDGCI